jgi:hypothetical protein
MGYFTKAGEVKKCLKVCVYGSPGAGKTHFALTFPKPAVIDLEHGSDLLTDRFDFEVLHTKSCSEVMGAVEAISQNPESFETLIIDPISVIWEGLQDAYVEDLEQKIQAGRSRRTDSELQFADWKRVKRPHRRLTTLLLNLPMNVVLCGRLASEYEMKNGELLKVGVKMEAEKTVPYVLDLLIRLEIQNGKRVGVVEKDRSGMFDGQTIEAPSFATFKPILDRMNGTEPVVYEDDDEVTRKDASLFKNPRMEEMKRTILQAQEALSRDFGEEGETAFQSVLEAYGVEEVSGLADEQIAVVITDLRQGYKELQERERRSAA